MRFPFVAAAFAVACLFVAPLPAYAQACQFVLPDVVASLQAQGMAHKVLTAEERVVFLADLEAAIELKTGLEADLSMVTEVVLATISGEVYFGVVIDGCLMPPEPLSAYLPEEKRSGWTPVGIFA